ncbi:ATP-binding protein [Streptomyces sp. NRRL F-2664]|uniref:ATP-binding protein n=1 Tax=Streptomyces sp. NRRL F-2664 TaxID=1463842 RepID=UPI0022771AF6|nr:ATP-binding protein [Streptomyces sp. NRRL F-2664]
MIAPPRLSADQKHAVSASEQVVDATRRHWALPYNSGAASLARCMTQKVLETWGIDQVFVEDALLVVSELVTNAVEHALPPVTLYLAQSVPGPGLLRVAVGDGGPSPHAGKWVASCESGEHGRGRIIVNALAVSQGVRTVTGNRTQHWADLPVIFE